MKRMSRKKEADGVRDKHELLQQEGFRWLTEFREVLSPYWSLRMDYQTTNARRVS